MSPFGTLTELSTKTLGNAVGHGCRSKCMLSQARLSNICHLPSSAPAYALSATSAPSNPYPDITVSLWIPSFACRTSSVESQRKCLGGWKMIYNPECGSFHCRFRFPASGIALHISTTLMTFKTGATAYRTAASAH